MQSHPCLSCETQLNISTEVVECISCGAVMKVTEWEPLQLELLTEPMVLVEEIDDDEPDTELVSFMAQQISVFLEQMGIATQAVDNELYIVHLGRVLQQGPRISIVDVLIDDNDPDSIIVQAEIHFALNTENEDSYIVDHAVGWAQTLEEAIAIAAHSWCRLTAPPVFFIIFSMLKADVPLEVEWFADGDPNGISGWDICASGYGFEGSDRERVWLHQFLRDNGSLMKMLSNAICAEISEDKVNYVKLYCAFNGQDVLTEGFVNGLMNERLSEELKKLYWPECREFVAVSQFFILIPTSE